MVSESVNATDPAAMKAKQVSDGQVELELREELSAMKPSGRRKRALMVGVSPERLLDADDADDPTAVTIGLIVQAAAAKALLDSQPRVAPRHVITQVRSRDLAHELEFLPSGKNSVLDVTATISKLMDCVDYEGSRVMHELSLVDFGSIKFVALSITGGKAAEKIRAACDILQLESLGMQEAVQLWRKHFLAMESNFEEHFCRHLNQLCGGVDELNHALNSTEFNGEIHSALQQVTSRRFALLGTKNFEPKAAAVTAMPDRNRKLKPMDEFVERASGVFSDFFADLPACWIPLLAPEYHLANVIGLQVIAAVMTLYDCRPAVMLSELQPLTALRTVAGGPSGAGGRQAVQCRPVRGRQVIGADVGPRRRPVRERPRLRQPAVRPTAALALRRERRRPARGLG